MSKNILVALLSLAFISNTFAAGDATKGKMLYMTCAACHGANGEGQQALKAPSIFQQEDWYLIAQLKKFKTGVRGAHAKDIEGMQMAPMAKFLKDDAAINDVVAYINELSK